MENVITMDMWQRAFAEKWQELLGRQRAPLTTYPLYHCSARVEYWGGGDIMTLRSYNTVVAIYDDRHSTVYVNGYYSSTTCQHISKFCRFVVEKGGEVHRKVCAYLDSDNCLGYDYKDRVYYKWYARKPEHLAYYRRGCAGRNIAAEDMKNIF